MGGVGGIPLTSWPGMWYSADSPEWLWWDSGRCNLIVVGREGHQRGFLNPFPTQQMETSSGSAGRPHLGLEPEPSVVWMGQGLCLLPSSSRDLPDLDGISETTLLFRLQQAVSLYLTNHKRLLVRTWDWVELKWPSCSLIRLWFCFPLLQNIYSGPFNNWRHSQSR